MKTAVLMSALALLSCGPRYSGTYSASWSGTWTNTTPTTSSGTSAYRATITVTELGPSQIRMAWQVENNPESGEILFAMNGLTGNQTGGGVTGTCFNGRLGSDTINACCSTCTITFDGDDRFTQSQSGAYTGRTSANVDIGGSYAGSWSAARLQR